MKKKKKTLKLRQFFFQTICFTHDVLPYENAMEDLEEEFEVSNPQQLYDLIKDRKYAWTAKPSSKIREVNYCRADTYRMSTAQLDFEKYAT